MTLRTSRPVYGLQEPMSQQLCWAKGMVYGGLNFVEHGLPLPYLCAGCVPTLPNQAKLRGTE
jgi:hypothetical protein